MYSEDLKETAKKLTEQGLSRFRVSRQLGIPVSTISKWVIGINSDKYLHPQEVKDKARELAKNGMSRSEISKTLNVPEATLCKWVKGLGLQPIRYGLEDRQEAERLYENGLSRPQIASKMGINIKTISAWLKPSDHKKPYPLELRKKAKLMAKRGVAKGEIAMRLKVNYVTICRWTGDLTNRYSHVNGRYFLALAEIAKKGYMVSSRKDVFVFKFLKRYVPVKSILIGRSAVYYLEGSEMKVFNNIVKRSDLKLNEAKIENLRTAFGLWK